MEARNTHQGPYGVAELIVNSDGSIYHLNIQPDEVRPTVLLVGDPDRVEVISSRCDQVFSKQQTREFAVHHARLGQRELSIVSTGIGVDNIDIVLNELDACMNIDFASRKQKDKLTSLNIIRLGTSGAVQPGIALGSLCASVGAIGMDGVPFHYDMKMSSTEVQIQQDFIAQMGWESPLPSPYVAMADESLVKEIAQDMFQGITLTANGFYGPQGRNLRLSRSQPELLNGLKDLDLAGHRLTNLEMECAGIYALGGMLGHKVLTCCALLANRYDNSFVDNPQIHVSALIDAVLSRLT